MRILSIYSQLLGIGYLLGIELGQYSSTLLENTVRVILMVIALIHLLSYFSQKSRGVNNAEQSN